MTAYCLSVIISFSRDGGVPEWLKGTGCKPVGYAYLGSNPSPPAIFRTSKPLFGAAFSLSAERRRRGRESPPLPCALFGFGDDEEQSQGQNAHDGHAEVQVRVPQKRRHDAQQDGADAHAHVEQHVERGVGHR